MHAVLARLRAFEKNSKPRRRQICVDFDFSDFSGLRGSGERDRTTAEWDWQPDADAGSTSLKMSVRGERPMIVRSDRRRRGSPRAGEVKPVPGGPGAQARRLSRDRVADGRRGSVRHLDRSPTIRRGRSSWSATTRALPTGRRQPGGQGGRAAQGGDGLSVEAPGSRSRRRSRRRRGWRGGSSDAAATLVALDRLWDLGMPARPARRAGGGDRQRRGLLPARPGGGLSRAGRAGGARRTLGSRCTSCWSRPPSA